MEQDKKDLIHLIESLNERAKELNCLYRVDEILKNTTGSEAETLQTLAEVIPEGWQFPNVCRVRIIERDKRITSEDFRESDWHLSSEIQLDGESVGRLDVFYVEKVHPDDASPFLAEEQRLLDTIAERIGDWLSRRKLRNSIEEWEKVKASLDDRSDWKIILRMLEKSDIESYYRIGRQMLNYLCWTGVRDAKKILRSISPENADSPSILETNVPLKTSDRIVYRESINRTFEIAREVLSDDEIMGFMQKWVQEDKISFLVQILENPAMTMGDIQNAITRYHHQGLSRVELSGYSRMNINVRLIHRFFTDQLEYINIAKNFVGVTDFYNLVQRMIFPANSHGRLGGKSAGIFLAGCILKSLKKEKDFADWISLPRTWYITSDTLHNFLAYNNLKGIIEQKYKEIEQVREEYSNVIQVFKNSYFPPDVIKGLSLALEDFGDKPIIVRSSSLLEDRVGASFAGKYKSLFLANQGSREEKLTALMDAVAEVWASTFGPDPIEYRRERGLLDFHEEMAIIIQEVVGKRVGPYFFPSFAGVAFSNNEFRWSPRIKRDDGLLRIVPGLGTRAVDRLSNDYPILASPGQPDLRVNVSPEEICRYSPQFVDLINLEENTFETLGVQELLKEVGHDYPAVEKVVSVVQGSAIKEKSRINLDFEHDDLVVTFEGLFRKTPFIQRLKRVLDTLQERMDFPVDVEFASTGDNLTLLQCRAQGYTKDNIPAMIPKDIPQDDILFTAQRFVSNGMVPDISHIVYVDGESYLSLPTFEDMKRIGRIVGQLNKILPKRKFILIGPGRWGSRGDIKLGVSVTYADISNTAMLVEVARQRGNYVPDLSFGTHFFQDLVESSIRYLPLYPDDQEVVFNEHFFQRSGNILARLLPQYQKDEGTVRVFDVPEATGGRVLRVRMNADLDEAMGWFAAPSQGIRTREAAEIATTGTPENHWAWRYRMAERIAREIEDEKLGVEAMYIFGSTKNANAGPGSDIDLLIHFKGDDDQKKELFSWLRGWSLCLSEMNYLRTGYKTKGLLDVHLVTDEDIANKTSYAVKIGAVTDAARPLPLGRESGK